jgi:dolichol-phosphate mannosyltransferase
MTRLSGDRTVRTTKVIFQASDAVLDRAQPEQPVTEPVLVVLPTYNERANLPLIVPAILAQDARIEILVVDDSSPDGTGQLADEMAAGEPRIHVLHRTAKQGLGRAYLAGFDWALARDYAYIFEMDADFSHDPKFIPDFLSAAGTADLVIGSRYKRGVNVVNWPMSRLLLSYGANLYARWVTGLPLTDATGGFKCFRRRVLQAIDFSKIRSNGYAFQIEMSYRAWNKGFELAEIPIVFVDRVEGQSKMSKRIVREAIWMVWWLRWLAIARKL